MIARLSGVLDQIGGDGVVVDVGGVGYLVFCSGRTIGRLPPAGGAVRLLVETHVREDHIHLYGFADAAERDGFRLLTTVQGVGARLALAILSAVAPDQLVLAVAAQDRAALTRADGVGPKLAQRIVNELRDKIGAGAGRAGPRAAARGCRLGGDRRCGLGAGESEDRPGRSLWRDRRRVAPAGRRRGGRGADRRRAARAGAGGTAG
jgi:Holliday junction DNA helicase RuvA